MPMHVGEAALDAVVVEGEALVVQSKEVQRGGVEIVGVGGVHHRLPAKFIRGTVVCAAPNAAVGRPNNAKAEW